MEGGVHSGFLFESFVECSCDSVVEVYVAFCSWRTGCMTIAVCAIAAEN